MQKLQHVKPTCLACREWRRRGAFYAVALTVLALTALALGACSLDRERLASAREDIREVCDGAISIPLRTWCARVIVPEVPQEKSNP